MADPSADYSIITQKYFPASASSQRNHVYIVLGALLFWCGYIFFVGGRTLGQNGIARENNSSKIIMNMFIASGFSALWSITLKNVILWRVCSRAAKYDVLTLANGIIIGCAAISGVANNCDNWGAVLIGSISAAFYVGGILFEQFWGIDDPLEVFPVHFCGGLWGLFATGFFDQVRGALFYGGHQQG